MGQGKSKSDATQEVKPPPPLPAMLAKAAERPPRQGPSPHNFDKSFRVHLSSDRGVANGVGRNISPQGMFVETREPCSIGSEVRITFSAEGLGAEIVAVGEVRFQCYLNYTDGEGNGEGMRGMGIRFLRFEVPDSTPGVQPVLH